MVPSPGEAKPGRNAGLQECELAGELGTPGILRPPVLPLCLLLATWAPRPTTQAAAGRVTRRKASDRPTRGWGWGGARWLGLPCVSPPPPASSPLLRRRAFLGRHLFATSSFLSRLAPERVNLFGLGSQLLSNLHRPSWAAPPSRRNPPSRPPGPRIHDTRACNLFKGVVESTFRKQPTHRRR